MMPPDKPLYPVEARRELHAYFVLLDHESRASACFLAPSSVACSSPRASQQSKYASAVWSTQIAFASCRAIATNQWSCPGGRRWDSGAGTSCPLTVMVSGLMRNRHADSSPRKNSAHIAVVVACVIVTHSFFTPAAVGAVLIACISLPSAFARQSALKSVAIFDRLYCSFDKSALRGAGGPVRMGFVQCLHHM